MGKMESRNKIIKKNKIWSITIVLLLSAIGVNAFTNEVKNTTKRVPAEWEAQEAIWMQWPGYWEKEYF